MRFIKKINELTEQEKMNIIKEANQAKKRIVILRTEDENQQRLRRKIAQIMTFSWIVTLFRSLFY